MDNLQSLILKIVKFGIVGMSGIFVDFSITWILKEKAKLNKYVSNAAGFSTAVVSNFFLNYIWTFKGAAVSVAGAFWLFFIISLAGLLLNTGFIYLMHEKKKVNFYLSKLIAIALVFCWNFSANYFFNFHSVAK